MFKKSKWLPDTRLLIGIVLIATSFLGVYAVVNANNSKVQVYAAGVPLAVGEKVEVSKLTLVEANLGGSLDRYVLPSQLENAVVNRPVLPGELLPKSALLPLHDQDLASVVISVMGELGADIQTGGLVDVWAASRVREFWQSNLLASALRVIRIDREQKPFDSQRQTQVELQTVRKNLPYLLDAIANQDKLSLVSSAGSQLGDAPPADDQSAEAGETAPSALQKTRQKGSSGASVGGTASISSSATAEVSVAESGAAAEPPTGR